MGYPDTGYIILNMSKSTYSEKYRAVIEKLKNIRMQNEWTQEEVSAKLSKPQSYISKIERGERRLDILELKELADLYKKEITFFIK